MGKALPRRIGRHTHPQARPEAAPEPRASGIDYLGLVAARVAAEESRRIGYAAMATGGPDTLSDEASSLRGEPSQQTHGPDWGQPGLFDGAEGGRAS